VSATTRLRVSIRTTTQPRTHRLQDTALLPVNKRIHNLVIIASAAARIYTMRNLPNDPQGNPHVTPFAESSATDPGPSHRGEVGQVGYFHDRQGLNLLAQAARLVDNRQVRASAAVRRSQGLLTSDEGQTARAASAPQSQINVSEVQGPPSWQGPIELVLKAR
jgi:hypothetical protein